MSGKPSQQAAPAVAKPAQRNVARPRDGRNPPTSMAAIMGLKAAMARPDEPLISVPSAASKVLSALAARSKEMLADEDAEQPAVAVKREGEEATAARPTAFPAEAANGLTSRRKRARLDLGPLIISEIRAVGSLPKDSVRRLMETELTILEPEVPHPVDAEDVLEFHSALFAASTLYAAHAAVQGQSGATRPRGYAPRACKTCKKAHMACDAGRPCARCTRMGRLDCSDGERDNDPDRDDDSGSELERGGLVRTVLA
ncbi:hypothetical protein DFJ74DRAFT_331700 [Hyaloraphidium curvatum]|nr:hypothetical protein DFJ74DRAFT_331700 [Hyaloraphidium curvatum]